MQEYKVKVYDYVTEWLNSKGQRHRKDGPAMEWTDGTKYWYLNGQLHRKDGPATEHADGTKLWYLKGEEYTETEFNKKTGKGCPETIIINGTKYQKIK